MDRYYREIFPSGKISIEKYEGRRRKYVFLENSSHSPPAVWQG